MSGWITAWLERFGIAQGRAWHITRRLTFHDWFLWSTVLSQSEHMETGTVETVVSYRFGPFGYELLRVTQRIR